MKPLHFQPVGTPVGNTLNNLAEPSTAHQFALLANPSPAMSLRDLEPLVGAVVRSASPMKNERILAGPALLFRPTSRIMAICASAMAGPCGFPDTSRNAYPFLSGRFTKQSIG